MPTVFSAKLDGSEAVRYAHISLVVFYLRQARMHALAAMKLQAGEDQFAEALLAVILSALCLEAFANETGENLLPDAELKDFLLARKAYQRPNGIGSVAWKLTIVFEKKWSHQITPGSALIQEIEGLFQLRNELVHYKLGETAAKSYLPPPARIANAETGEVMTVFDFMLPATRVEQSLVVRVNGQAAVRAYNTALRVLKLWNEKAGAPVGALSAHQELQA